MPKTDDKKFENQRNVYDFFVERFRTQAAFTKADLEAVTTWRGQSFDTYWSKQFKQFVYLVDGDQFRVSDAFRPYATWDAFRRHVTQVRRVSSDYSSLLFDAVMMFDFFMPLTNEAHLRNALDSLFYKDTIMKRLKGLSSGALRKRFEKQPGETDDAYYERLCEWIAKRFVGYSIGNVAGRFRMQELMTMVEATSFEEQGGRYLADETTAVVRFIFPCGSPLKKRPPQSTREFDDPSDLLVGDDAVEDADRVRWLFKALFVRSILQVVNGEAEIWMIESGLRNRLHIWRVEGEE